MKSGSLRQNPCFTISCTAAVFVVQRLKSKEKENKLKMIEDENDSVMMAQTAKAKANPMFSGGHQESGEEFVATNFLQLAWQMKTSHDK